MLTKITRKRTRLEKQEWENVRDLMPRKNTTRGMHYETLEFLFAHLYEKVSEEQLHDHLLEVKGHLQAKGDPVKSAINLAIKELQRLRDPMFELIKIQEPSLNGKVIRYVQLIFRGFDAVMGYSRYLNYLEDLVADEEGLIIKSVFDSPLEAPSQIFPGVDSQFLHKNHAQVLMPPTNSLYFTEKQVQWSVIPESFANHSFLLLYEPAKPDQPFLGFVSNLAAVKSLEDTHYIMYRGETKRTKLKFLHEIWHAMQKLSISPQALKRLQQQAKALACQLKNQTPALHEEAVFQGLFMQKVQETRSHYMDLPLPKKVG